MIDSVAKLVYCHEAMFIISFDIAMMLHNCNVVCKGEASGVVKCDTMLTKLDQENWYSLF